MKALSIAAPGIAAFRELAQPTPAADEVLLRVRYVGYCGSDLTTYRGLNPLVSYPRIPGHEVSGMVAAVGAGVGPGIRPGMAALVIPYTSCGTCPSCRAGRANCCASNQTLGVQRDGALVEWLVAPAAKVIVASALDLRALAMVEPLTIGLHAVDRARVRSGEVVAVFGCGMIGLGAVAAAARRGARVIAVDLDPAKLAMARTVGAAEGVLVGDDLVARLRALTAGEGPAVAIEAAGAPASFRSCVEAVAFAGRVACIGYAKSPVAYENKHVVQKELDILGSRNAMPADFHAVIAMLIAGDFPLATLVSRTVPFAEAAEALAAWDRDPVGTIKILVEMADNPATQSQIIGNITGNY